VAERKDLNSCSNSSSSSTCYCTLLKSLFNIRIEPVFSIHKIEKYFKLLCCQQIVFCAQIEGYQINKCTYYIVRVCMCT
jgi:hypothetical protein